jgi:broad specificity phosphatase PhoE
VPVVYLVRHGQASFGAEDYDVLSPTGHKQAELVAQALVRRGVQPAVIVSGSLKRQLSTAKTCCGAASWEQPVSVDPRWDEYGQDAVMSSAAVAADLSSPEGVKEASRIAQVDLDTALVNWVTKGLAGPSGRTWKGFRDGVLAALQDVMDSAGRGGAGLVFTSAGVIGAICAELLGADVHAFMSLNRVMVNTGVTKVVSGRGGMNLLSVNDHGHLEGEAALLTYR